MTDKGLIMVVDDEWLNRELIEGVLNLYGYKVILAANGDQALKMAAEHHPDLILLDIRMPNLDGYEVCKTIKADPATQSSLVILVSGLEGNLDERQQATNAGADDFVSRSIPIEQMIQRVEDLLLKHKTDD